MSAKRTTAKKRAAQTPATLKGLNIQVDLITMTKAKAKAALEGLTLKDFVIAAIKARI